MIVGVLPASGEARRLNGLPKFLLPIENGCLLTWHINQMLEVCDEVRVSVSPSLAPFIREMALPFKVKVVEMKTRSLLDAAKNLLSTDYGVIGMPDTYICNTKENMYKRLLESDGDVVLAKFECPEYLMGHVGQLSVAEDNNLLDLQDKVTGCVYPFMWGAIALKNAQIAELTDDLPTQIHQWVSKGKSIKATQCDGEYIDAGTLLGVKRLYSNAL